MFGGLKPALKQRQTSSLLHLRLLANSQLSGGIFGCLRFMLCVLLAFGFGVSRPAELQAQRLTGWSLTGGPTVATQRWDNFDQRPLLGYHAGVTVEQIDYDRGNGLYASLGYHQRGSAIKTPNFRYQDPSTGEERVYRSDAIKFLFHNVVLAAGAKKNYAIGEKRGYVGFGLRGEANVGTDFAEEAGDQAINYGYGLAYPTKEFVRRFVYGIDLEGGIEVPLAARLDGIAALRLSPDIARQYFQGPVPYYNAFTRQNEIAPERKILNVSIELSLGIRFLPKAEFE